MDAKKFGTFVADVRKQKGMTQADLADKLQVTDKAISRWERGLGFPDIELLEPLSDALGLSVLELLQSQHITEQKMTIEDVSQTFIETIDVAKAQMKMWRQIMVAVFGVLLLIGLSSLVPGWFGLNLHMAIPVILGIVILSVAFLVAQKKRISSIQPRDRANRENT